MGRKQVLFPHVSNSPRYSPIAAVKQMASSLAVEWARNGVRVNALRYRISFDCSDRVLSHYCISPGYVLTKLTRTILSSKPELKVTFSPLSVSRSDDLMVPVRKRGRI